MISIIPPVKRWGIPLFQVALVLLLALLAEGVWEDGSRRAVLFGGVVSVANLLWLQWRLRRTEKRIPRSEIERDSGQGARKIVASLYLAALERFLLVSSLLVFGLLRLELEPLSLIAGFVVGQVALVIGSSHGFGDGAGKQKGSMDTIQ